MPSLARPSVISVAVMAAPLSLIAARARPRFLHRLRQTVGYVLGRFRQIPLQMAGQPRVIVEHAEQDRRLPFATRRQHLFGADMTIPVPEYAPRRILWLMQTSALCGLARRSARVRCG